MSEATLEELRARFIVDADLMEEIEAVNRFKRVSFKEPSIRRTRDPVFRDVLHRFTRIVQGIESSDRELTSADAGTVLEECAYVVGACLKELAR